MVANVLNICCSKYDEVSKSDSVMVLDYIIVFTDLHLANLFVSPQLITQAQACFVHWSVS